MLQTDEEREYLYFKKSSNNKITRLMPKSNKRAAPTTTIRTKRPRAEVHPLQEKLAERTAAKVRQSRDSAGIIFGGCAFFPSENHPFSLRNHAMDVKIHDGFSHPRWIFTSTMDFHIHGNPSWMCLPFTNWPLFPSEKNPCPKLTSFSLRKKIHDQN